MQIDGLTAGGASASTDIRTEAEKKRDEFLRLFVAQLEHQDPLEPQDASEFVAQIAQFASLEQLAESNERLAQIEGNQATLAGTSLAAMVGQTTTARVQNIYVDPAWGGTAPLSVKLDRPASSVDVVIRDSDGTEVRRISVNGAAGGTVPFTWDGKANDGTLVPKGSYIVEVSAGDSTGANVGAEVQVRGPLEAIDFTLGFPGLRFGFLTVTPGDVIAIGG